MVSLGRFGWQSLKCLLGIPGLAQPPFEGLVRVRSVSMEMYVE